MTGLSAAMRLDLWVLRPYVRQLGAFVAAMLIFGFFTGWGSNGLIIAAIYAAPLASYPFAASEKSRLETMYASLPVARATLKGALLPLSPLMAFSSAARKSSRFINVLVMAGSSEDVGVVAKS